MKRPRSAAVAATFLVLASAGTGAVMAQSDEAETQFCEQLAAAVSTELEVSECLAFLGEAPFVVEAAVLDLTDDDENGTAPETEQQDGTALSPGDSFYLADRDTTVTLNRAVFGTKRQFGKPDKGMTDLALSFTFEAGPDGGWRHPWNIDIYDAAGNIYDDQVIFAKGKYSNDFGSGDIRANKKVTGWTVIEVPRNAQQLEVVYDDDEQPTWIIDR